MLTALCSGGISKIFRCQILNLVVLTSTQFVSLVLPLVVLVTLEGVGQTMASRHH